jgi:3-oxoacyl-[acyl-carrier-protein] synthase II
LVNIVITGIGLVSALGKSLEESWENLLAGKTGIKLYQPFPEQEPLPLGLIGQRPSELSYLTQMVVESVLQDARLEPPLPDCAVVIGSSRGYQASWEKLLRKMSGENLGLDSASLSLENWLYTLPHMNAIAVAKQIGACGTVLAPMAACATGIWTISQAALLIKSGQYQQAIAGAVEAAITPLTLSGFRQMGALAKTGVYPFDIQREGLALGEGAALFVLESATSAKQRQAKIYGEILGFGLTSDAYHSNQPEPTGKSLNFAIKQCLANSGLQTKDIDFIHAHGTATQLNDRIESGIIQSLFNQGVAVSSTKGSSGHTLGASGALGVAFSCMALRHQVLPPCVGLQQPEFDLDFVTETRVSQIKQALVLSCGFGGSNTVIALARRG